MLAINNENIVRSVRNNINRQNNCLEANLNKTINEVFKNDYLLKFTSTFVEAGKLSKVSPVYLASLSKQEVGGSSTPNSAISGKVAGYENYFNFYNYSWN